MSILNYLSNNPSIATAQKLGKLKQQIDLILPKHLHLQYNLSISKEKTPTILIHNPIWLLQIKQHEKNIKDVLNNSNLQLFSASQNNLAIKWRVITTNY